MVYGVFSKFLAVDLHCKTHGKHIALSGMMLYTVFLKSVA